MSQHFAVTSYTIVLVFFLIQLCSGLIVEIYNCHMHSTAEVWSEKKQEFCCWKYDICSFGDKGYVEEPSCIVSGCNDQFCIAAPRLRRNIEHLENSSDECTWKDEFLCLRFAECTVQAD
eukprot:Awhi_evm1s15716